ncbi:LRP chaperone MESD-like [Gigantopelta aegis]|uniref:LRP chaperone MESD-like n=1 Tax=Gigantopelta aegis TaxID=1735272 RepID=UPI001B888995|nr:LRP chaperone MESD-like [Gigantopelta aegis]
MSSAIHFLFVLLFSLFVINAVFCDSDQTDRKEEEKWKKKDIRDYDDGDVERLYDQWEDAEDEPLDEDEQPEWKRTPKPIDMSKLNLEDPEGVLKMTKQGKSLMMFATVSGDPTEKETETITALWQSSMFNAHLEMQRYIVGPNRVLFMVPDGSKAWDVKNYLIQQEKCAEVTIDGQNYPGKGAKKTGAKDDKKKTDKKTTDKDKKKSKEVKKDKKKSDNDIKKEKKSDSKDKKQKGKEEDNKTGRKTEKKKDRKKTEL